jgi:uncharacterized membrane protein
MITLNELIELGFKVHINKYFPDIINDYYLDIKVAVDMKDNDIYLWYNEHKKKLEFIVHNDHDYYTNRMQIYPKDINELKYIIEFFQREK